MLCRNPMPRTDDAALQQRERGFNGVRIDIAVNVDAGLVLDGLVLRLKSCPDTKPCDVGWVI
jgi:hypothetical protein